MTCSDASASACAMIDPPVAQHKSDLSVTDACTLCMHLSGWLDSGRTILALDSLHPGFKAGNSLQQRVHLHVLAECPQP